MNSPLFFESAGDERGTPQDFFDRLNVEFQFDIDVAASSKNHKVEQWFGEGGVANDALEEDWCGLTCFMNPPYSVAGAFIKKAVEEAAKGAVVVALVPVRSDTKWWHNYVWDVKADRPGATVGDPYDGWLRPGVSLRFIPGRLNFTLAIDPEHRAWIKESLAETPVNLGGGTKRAKTPTEQRLERSDKLRQMVELTGLPKMALERICLDYPDEDLLDAAPFPSCVLIFRKP